MSWKKIILTNRQVAHGHLERILSQYLPLMVKSGNANLASPFMSNPDSDGTTRVNFPPEASPSWDEILLEYSAVSCDAPNEPLIPMVRQRQSKGEC